MGGRITHNGYPHAHNREVILYRDVLLLFIEWFDVGWSMQRDCRRDILRYTWPFCLLWRHCVSILQVYSDSSSIYSLSRKIATICNPIRHIHVSYSFICFWNVSSSLWYRTYTCRTIGNPHHFNQANMYVHTVCHW